jgi:hypothetical protein
LRQNETVERGGVLSALGLGPTIFFQVFEISMPGDGFTPSSTRKKRKKRKKEPPGILLISLY